MQVSYQNYWPIKLLENLKKNNKDQWNKNNILKKYVTVAWITIQTLSVQKNIKIWLTSFN